MNFNKNFTNVLNTINVKGKKRFGTHFTLYRDDYEIIYQLAGYFLREEEVCKKYKLDLTKGILLTGPVGCGKTSLMELFSSMTHKEQRYCLKTARSLSIGFSSEGIDGIKHHMTPTGSIKHLFIDDIGVETMAFHYGQKYNTIAEILLSRYELFRLKGILTHASTNLSASELQERYGNRVRSRMRQMFNLINFPADAKDKR